MKDQRLSKLTNIFKVSKVSFLWSNSYSLLHPDVFWYRLNGVGTQKNVPKKVFDTFSIYISYKTK